MLIHLPLVFVSLYLTTAKAGLSYTKVSYATETKEQCINDCVEGVCAIWSIKKNYYYGKYCIAGDELAPMYYTAQFKKKVAICLSRCDYNGYKFEWCYVDNKENWDFCSTRIDNKLIQGQETIEDGPCVDECVFGVFSCTDLKGKKRDCRPKMYVYSPANNIYGEECIGKCFPGVNNFFFCYMKVETAVCAPSADPRMPEIFGTLSPPDCKKDNLEKCGFLKTVDVIQKAPYFRKFNVNEAKNPVKWYTIKPVAIFMTHGVVPMLIRATITRETVRPVDGVTFPNKLEDSLLWNVYYFGKIEDVPVSLISYRMGGKNETFNVIPVSSSVKEKIGILQDSICETVLQGKYKSAVVVTVLVTYTRYLKVEAVIYRLDRFKDGQLVKSNVYYF